VEDNGRGVPPGFDPQASADLGLKIVHALVTEDLGGTLEYAGGTGTRALITLPRLERPYG
ncbi:MAG: ATPase, partial [Armatimonadota bacterium]|nr:ATPase [Armatimonadota bacterium]